MRPSHLLLGLGLGLLASTSSALPATASDPTSHTTLFNQTLPELDRRGHYGWVASFATSDPHCKGGYAGPRPKIHSDCVEFHPVQTRVKIDWGTGPLGFHMLEVFLDSKCKIKTRTIHKGKSGDSCVATRGLWGSVKYTDVEVGPTSNSGIS